MKNSLAEQMVVPIRCDGTSLNLNGIHHIGIGGKLCKYSELSGQNLKGFKEAWDNTPWGAQVIFDEIKKLDPINDKDEINRLLGYAKKFEWINQTQNNNKIYCSLCNKELFMTGNRRGPGSGFRHLNLEIDGTFSHKDCNTEYGETK